MVISDYIFLNKSAPYQYIFYCVAGMLSFDL